MLAAEAPPGEHRFRVAGIDALSRQRARATFAEMVNLMSELEFDYYDDVGEWRSPL